MKEIKNLIKRLTQHAKLSGLAITTVSRKVFNDGKKIGILINGGGLTMKTFAQANRRLEAMEKDIKKKKIKGKIK